MTNFRSGLFQTKKLLSNDWIVYLVVSVTIIGVIFESGVIRVSGFENRSITTYVFFYGSLSVFCIISQLVILNYVDNKIEKSLVSRSHLHMSTINKIILTIQLAISVLIIVILLQIVFTNTYQTIFIIAVLVTSFLTAATIMALLSWRFIIWLKSRKNRIIMAYLFASLFISISAISGVLYFLDKLLYEPAVVHPRQHADFIIHKETGNSSLLYLYSIFSAVAFVLLWVGTVFLLQSYRKKIGNSKYWIIMSVPLLYFLSQFQPVVLNFLLSYASDNPALFNLIYIIMMDASRPIGGVLFSFAFIQVARKLQNPRVKGYLLVSGVGLLLLLVSHNAQALITTPFPPLGLLAGSYFGLSSYLIFVGIYLTALSISQDSILRSSIRRSVENEVEFLNSIGNAEMNNRILERVLLTSKNIAQIMPEETGISSSLTDNEIKEYVEVVLALALKKKAKTVN